MNSTDEQFNPLIRAIIAHYQFEAIHPFHDGNGKIGRILMILQLIQSDLLEFPVLYISNFINSFRNDYYLKLREVKSAEKWFEYINFMLTGFRIQSLETRLTLAKMNSLFQEIKQKVKKENNKIYSVDLIEALFTFPVITPTSLAEKINIHYTTASKYLMQLVKLGILRDAKVGKHHFFVNFQLVDLLS